MGSCQASERARARRRTTPAGAGRTCAVGSANAGLQRERSAGWSARTTRAIRPSVVSSREMYACSLRPATSRRTLRRQRGIRRPARSSESRMESPPWRSVPSRVRALKMRPCLDVARDVPHPPAPARAIGSRTRRREIGARQRQPPGRSRINEEAAPLRFGGARRGRDERRGSDRRERAKPRHRREGSG